MEWLRSLFGGMPKPTYYGDAPRGEWPSEQALGMARQYDQAYGSTAAGFVEPNATGLMRQPRSFEEYARAFDFVSGDRVGGEYPDARLEPGRPAVKASKGQRAVPTQPERVVVGPDPMAAAGPLRPMSPSQAGRMNEANVAANYSALAAIGFDPRRLAAGVPEAGISSNYGGAYPIFWEGKPKYDLMISSGQTSNSPVHESLHRGIQKLRESGRLPVSAQEVLSPGNPQEESVVRAFMFKNFGPVEAYKDMVSIGKQVTELPKGAAIMRDLEAAAAEQYARDTPTGEYRRGPR